jgi:hypothetical protein
MAEIEEPVPLGRLPDREDTSAPRSIWAPGPWDDEADKYEWRHLGFPCLIVRGSMGALCGYVGVAPGHPWHGKTCSDDALDQVACHGGPTYADQCNGDICHTPREGEPRDVWWIGFDCGHYMDVSPGMEAMLRELRKHRPAGFPEEILDHLEISTARLRRGLREADRPQYRTVGYVAREVRNLAKQAHIAERPRRRS